LRNKLNKVLITSLFAQGLAGCGIDGPLGKISVIDDLRAPVRLQICEHHDCNFLNDRVAPGGTVQENVDLSLNPYNFLVVDARTGRVLGCLHVATKPELAASIKVSSMTADTSNCR
jgi:hypothetical protein